MGRESAIYGERVLYMGRESAIYGERECCIWGERVLYMGRERGGDIVKSLRYNVYPQSW